MIGIYKITNPKGRVYIGQSTDTEKRADNYRKSECKRQPRLYRSIVKYGFSEHIFEVKEECTVEELNVRERYWQDFYEVLGEYGLNCKLTGTEDKSGYYSEEAKKNISTSIAAYYQTPEGKENKARQMLNIDYKLRATNINFIARTANTDYVAKAKKYMKPIVQYEKDGTFIREWSSAKEAGESLQIKSSDITACCKGRQKTSGKFIWKYSEIKLEN